MMHPGTRRLSAGRVIPDLYCITAGELSRGRSNVAVVRCMLEAGVKLVQYREKKLPSVEKYRECLAIRELCRAHRACFIVNDAVDLALAVAADGVHVGQQDLPVAVVRRLVGKKMLVGLSVASPRQSDEAVASGMIDYLGVGPVYATVTKEDAGAPVGLDCLDYAVRTGGLPVVAIGGITRSNVAEVIRHGAACVAVISDIVAADDIAARIKSLQAAIARARGNSSVPLPNEGEGLG